MYRPPCVVAVYRPPIPPLGFFVFFLSFFYRPPEERITVLPSLPWVVCFISFSRCALVFASRGRGPASLPRLFKTRADRQSVRSDPIFEGMKLVLLRNKGGARARAAGGARGGRARRESVLETRRHLSMVHILSMDLLYMLHDTR